MKSGLQIVLLLLLSIGSTTVTAAEPREVLLTAYLIDIEDIDSVKQSFTVNLFVAVSWNDPDLVHGGSDSIAMDLDDIWYPRLQIINEQSLKPSFPRQVEVKPDGRVIFRQRYFGKLSQPLQLEKFPFDQQRLAIEIVGLAWGSTPYTLVADPESRLSGDLLMPDWNIRDWEFVAHTAPIGYKGNELPAATFYIDVERNTSFFTLKVIVPLLLIMSMSWLVLWLDPSMAAPRISVAVTTMLTLIAYRFAIGGMVPRLPFLTTLDYFVLAATILVFLSLATVIWSTRLHTLGHKERAQALDRGVRWIAPLLYAALIAETLYLHRLF